MFPEQKHSQNNIRLFDDLIPIDHQRMKRQEKGIFLRRGIFEIPPLMSF